VYQHCHYLRNAVFTSATTLSRALSFATARLLLFCIHRSAAEHSTLALPQSSRAEDEQRLRERGDECGLTKSEWCRQVILKALDVPSETCILLAEFMALRAVLLMLHTDLLQDCEVTRERIALRSSRATLRSTPWPTTGFGRSYLELTRIEGMQRIRERRSSPLRLLHSPIPLRLRLA
jgi:hypothetical protein